MTYDLLKDLYDAIRTDTDITSYIPAADIKVGWQNDFANYPSMSIIQTGGNATGQLGVNSSPSGQIRENFGVQIDIYSQTSIKEVYDILDQLTRTMVSSGYQKLSDVDDWDDTLSANHKITRWNKICQYYK